MTPTSLRTTSLTTESLIAAAASIPPGAPFVMLNMLRYRERAEYPAGSGTSLAPCTGREAYQRGYVATFVELAAGVDIGVEWFGSVLATLVSPPDERWDEFVLVRYPSYAAFRAIVESERYEREAAPHRLASLVDWRLLATAKLAQP
ncbi:MAG: hypothetical protein EOO75_12735 [Myxococcales bacterium]|nr:MAG: hypothetical protein EOO75_12735 [Myxococcales bacterium]